MKPRTVFRKSQWQPTPVLLPGKSHGWRSLVGYRPWSRKELDTTEQLHSFSFTRLASALILVLVPLTQEPASPIPCSILSAVCLPPWTSLTSTH